MTDLHWSDGVLPVLDFEATGVDPRQDRAVSVAFLLTTPRQRVLPGSFTSLIDPGIEVPAEAEAIHGLSTARLREEGSFPAEVFATLVQLIEAVAGLGWPLVMYNASYDWPMLVSEAQRHGIKFRRRPPLVDPLVLDRTVDRYRKGGRKLDRVTAHYGVQLNDAHDAGADALAAAGVLRALVKVHPSLRRLSLAELQGQQVTWHNGWVARTNRYFAKIGREDRVDETPWPGA